MNDNHISEQKLFEIASGIPDAHVDVNHYGKIHIGSNGAAIHIGAWKTSDKYHITVYWPSDKKNNYYRPSQYDPEESKVRVEINSSSQKRTELVVRDIVTRLLPGYLPLYAKMKAQADSHDAYEDKTEMACVRFAAETGIEYAPSKHGSRPRLSFYNNDKLGPADGTAEFYGDQVSLDLRSVPVDAALEIARVLREWGTKEGA